MDPEVPGPDMSVPAPVMDAKPKAAAKAKPKAARKRKK
jgi:hypothetical protein